MTPMPLLLLAAAAVGVDTGWTKLDSGGYEYIIQIPPEQLDALRAGGEFGSDLPADTGAIRSYRIVIGTGPLVNEGVPLPAEARVALKPIVEDAGATELAVQKPPLDGEESGAAARNATAAGDQRVEPVDVFRAVRGTTRASAPASDANKRPTDEELDDERFVGLGLNGRRVGNDNRETRSGDAAKADHPTIPSPPSTEAPSPNDATDEIVANEPREWSRSQFSWTMLVLGLIVCGGLNGYLGWLAIDFRNRYLELLRDLDTQPAESVESPRDQVEEEPSELHEEDSPRELVRSAHTFVGRKDNQRRRDREQDRYDEA